MSYTNSTPNYNLPQWIGTDKPTFLGDFNSAFSEIDTQMKANADASTAATATANSAAATATSANTNATTALSIANSAASEAASATSAAASAASTASTASSNADAALRASAANTIENLAPAYDPTLTYSVGDLVTYIDDQNSGKLYKCIVAVNSPMEFNINYWDDVTTSEAYTPKEKLLYTYTFDGTETYGEGMAAMYSDIIGLNVSRMIEGGFMYHPITKSDTELELSINQVNWGCNGLMRTIILASTSKIFRSLYIMPSAGSGQGLTLTANAERKDTEVPTAGTKWEFYGYN